MYAIFEAKGKQFRAEPDAVLKVPTLDAEPGDRVTFDHVLLAQKDDEVLVGRPGLDGAAVAVEVVRHGRGEKIVVYKMKRRKGYRRKQGHRQGFTEVRVVEIELGGGKVAKPKKAEKTDTVPEPAQPNATDSASELAAEAGIDLTSIAGTGKDGRILKSDVQKAIKERDEA